MNNSKGFKPSEDQDVSKVSKASGLTTRSPLGLFCWGLPAVPHPRIRQSEEERTPLPEMIPTQSGLLVLSGVVTSGADPFMGGLGVIRSTFKKKEKQMFMLYDLIKCFMAMISLIVIPGCLGRTYWF